MLFPRMGEKKEEAVHNVYLVRHDKHRTVINVAIFKVKKFRKWGFHPVGGMSRGQMVL
mgnify:CR=1 FL=1